MTIRDRVRELRRVPASMLISNPKNWRQHPKRQQAAMRAVLEEIGYADALLARENGEGQLVLIDGHLRADTTPETVVPVLVLDVTEEEGDKVLATLDPLAGMAEIDDDAWASLIGGIEFDVPEFGDLLAQLNPKPATAGLTDEDAVPEPPKEPVTRLGDLWLLGKHRLLCGDSTKAEDVERLMGGAKADLLLSDPPYGVSYIGKTKDALEIENDALDDAGLAALIAAAFDNAESACRAGAYWYATVPAGPLHLLFADDWNRRGILRQIMVWAKDSMVLGHSEYHYQHEPILFGWIPGERHRNEDRTRTTLWECPRPKASRDHPTTKPVALWARAIEDGSRPGETVYDPFLGSGTTVIAAEQRGRRCHGVEIDPIYADVVVRRWQEFTGLQATLDSEGASFEEITQRRAEERA